MTSFDSKRLTQFEQMVGSPSAVQWDGDRETIEGVIPCTFALCGVAIIIPDAQTPLEGVSRATP